MALGHCSKCDKYVDESDYLWDLDSCFDCAEYCLACDELIGDCNCKEAVSSEEFESIDKWIAKG